MLKAVELDFSSSLPLRVIYTGGPPQVFAVSGNHEERRRAVGHHEVWPECDSENLHDHQARSTALTECFPTHVGAVERQPGRVGTSVRRDSKPLQDSLA